MENSVRFGGVVVVVFGLVTVVRLSVTVVLLVMLGKGMPIFFLSLEVKSLSSSFFLLYRWKVLTSVSATLPSSFLGSSGMS